MDTYVRRALMIRLQILDEEIRHMAEDIIEAREQLAKAEKQLVSMNEERLAIADYMTKKD